MEEEKNIIIMVLYFSKANTRIIIKMEKQYINWIIMLMEKEKNIIKRVN